MSTATVVCVLRSGGDYDPRWVHALARGVAEHGGGRFVCLADVDVPGVECVALEYDWPRWWAKLEVFRPGLFDGPVLYLDLDTLVVGDLSDLLADHGPFAMLSDFNRPRRAQSGVMTWTPGDRMAQHIWDTFSRDPVLQMRRHRGDGEFIDSVTVAWRLQDRFPGQIVSLKRHCRRAAPPADARLVCFHGRPRPNDPRAGWGHLAWKELADAASAV